MDTYIIEETPDGDLVIYDDNKQEMLRFVGEAAWTDLLQWAQEQGLDLTASTNPFEWLENQRFAFRRRTRFSRLYRFRMNNVEQSDPPNVKRIVIPDFDDDDDPFEVGEYYDDNIELSPQNDDDDE